jgi:hypothetical protein
MILGKLKMDESLLGVAVAGLSLMLLRCLARFLFVWA